MTNSANTANTANYLPGGVSQVSLIMSQNFTFDMQKQHLKKDESNTKIFQQKNIIDRTVEIRLVT